MLENIEVLCHSSIKINKEMVIYIDPFRIKENYHDADIIFITHDHYDHYSEDDIDKIKKDDTIIVAHKGIGNKNLFSVEPNKRYEVKGINFETIPAYNINKQFHPKDDYN